jgi:hypothetical protein
MLREDGKADGGGSYYMLLVYLSEGGICIPDLYYCVYALLNVVDEVTCNTKKAMELVFLVQVISSVSFMLLFAPCVTEIVSGSDTCKFA